MMQTASPLTLSGHIDFRSPPLLPSLMRSRLPLSGTFVRALACPLVAGAGMLPYAAQAQASTTITARTTVVDNLSVVKSHDMDFGDIFVSSGAGTIVMTPTVTPTCTVTGGIVRSGACQPAEFVGAGRLNRLVRVRIPPSARMDITNAGGAIMRIDNMTVNGSPDTLVIRENSRTFRLLVLSLSGVFEFRIGGRLNVGATQATGTYSGNFDIDVQYF